MTPGLNNCHQQGVQLKVEWPIGFVDGFDDVFCSVCIIVVYMQIPQHEWMHLKTGDDHIYYLAKKLNINNV